MNRNLVYKLFARIFKTYKVMVEGKPFKKMYSASWATSNYIIINEELFIQDWKELYFCNDELVVRGAYGDLRVNVKYMMINSLRVGWSNDEDAMEVSTAKDEVW